MTAGYDDELREPIFAPRVLWGHEYVDISANDALAAGSDFRNQLYARDAGITPRTLRRARKALRIKPAKAGFDGGWVWALPEGGHERPKVAT